MDKAEEELYNFVGDELHELAWHNSYPINPSLGLWSFFEAFNNHDFIIDFNDTKREAQFILKNPFKKNPEILQTKLSYEQILKGWGHQPKSSPNTFYDSICIVYDTLEPPRNWADSKIIDNRNQWSIYRNSETKKVRQKMEDIWMPFFMKYQENMLFPVNGNVPELEKPKIFYQVIKKFPMNIYRNASIESLFPDEPDGIRYGPCAEHLVDLDMDGDLEVGEYYPNKSAMIEFFWGNYLKKLSEEKGYPLKYKSENKLKSLIIGGIESFELGYLLKWKV